MTLHLVARLSPWRRLIFHGGEAEILVVDSGSIDMTRATLDILSARISGLRWKYLYESIPGMLSGGQGGALEVVAIIVRFWTMTCDLIAAGLPSHVSESSCGSTEGCRKYANGRMAVSLEASRYPRLEVILDPRFIKVTSNSRTYGVSVVQRIFSNWGDGHRLGAPGEA